MAKIKVTNPKYVIDAHLKTNYFKLRNTGGPKGDKGDKGDTGATGPEGPQGATGATGRAATVAIGTTQTLNPGQSAFVNNVGTNNDAIFNFGIPQGEKGDKGDTGATGATGQAATVTVGTTTTLAAGSDATVNNSGSTSAAVLNFGIPKGDKGDTGEKGDTGGVRSEYVTELPASGQENTYYLTGDTATIGTASGESFQVTNNDNTGQVLLTQLSGNAEQTTYSGKNLVDSSTENFTPYNSAISETDGVLKMTANAGVLARMPLALPELTGGTTYAISFEVRGVSIADGGTFIRVRETSDGGSWISRQVNVSVSSSFTTGTIVFTPSSTVSPYLWFYLSTANTNTTNVEIYVKNIQLEQGSTATSYEPYVGGTASPNLDYPQDIETVTGEQTVGVTGKNLLNTNRELGAPSNTSYANTNPRIFDFSQYVKGISSNNYYAPSNITSYSVANNSVTLKTTQSAYGLGFAVPVLPSTTYFISYNAIPAGGIASIGYYKNTGEWISNHIPNGAFITPAECAFIIVSFRGSADNVETTYSNIQLELGSTATTYTPYQGQSYEINLGKNLLDVSNVNTGSGSNGLTMTANSDGSLTWAGTTTSTWAILTTYTTVNLKAGTYTLSIDKTLAYRFYVEAMLEDNTTQNMIIEAGQTSKTLTFTKNIKQIRLDLANFTNGQAYNETVKAQFEQSASATDFAPYFTPIELAKIGTYQDYIWNDNGVWKIHKEVGKVVLDGSESWTAQASNTGYMYRLYHVGVGSIASSSMSNLMSDYFTPTTGANIYNVTSGGYMAQLTVVDYIRFNIGDTTNKLADFKTWLGSHNATVYYQLATPTDTEITDDTLLAQLNTISELYGGVNNISIVPSAGAQGTITVKYTTWDKNNRYDVYIWNDTIGDFQIIHSGGGNN